MYKSTKHYSHDVGLSAVFRQWRADSHCNQLHGYALAITLEFGADHLDGRNWVVDFGALKPVKEWLQSMFDHKLLLAGDDPFFDAIYDLGPRGVADVQVVDAVGCEAFASLIYNYVDLWLATRYLAPMVRAYEGNASAVKPAQGLRLLSVEVREHGANSAIYAPAEPNIYNPLDLRK